MLIAAALWGDQAAAQNTFNNNQETQTMQTEIVKVLAPTGVLRASLNIGNPVLANLNAEGKPFGISIDLTTELGKRLGVPVELIVNETAGQSVATVESGRADVGFFAVDPERGKDISFTEAYVLIEGYYLVRTSSPITNNAQVDAPTNHIVVGKGSAYDLFLTRHIKQAQIERAPSSQAVVSTFLKDGFEVAAGVKQQLEADTRGVQGVRMLDERFMVIRQAMGVPKDRGPQAALFLRTFVEDMKARGFVKDAMTRHGIQGAGIAPVADPSVDPLSVK
jgi:polar amino acid transport system substrate-binding protein